MLRTLRIILAILSIAAVTLLFLDFTGTASRLWPWMAKIQFMPALLSANVLALLVILGMTILCGRVYCSVICPLGILQDVSTWMRGRVGKKRKNRFQYVRAHTRLRLVVLTVFAVLVVLGMMHAMLAAIAGLIEPYSAYGRIASQIFAPAYDGANNLLASWSESQGNYAFYRVACAVSVPVLAVAIVTLVLVVVMAWRGGRDYCNTVCPVGTILGYLSKISVLKPVIDTDKCINCTKCGRNCKAKCIDVKNHAIDYSRCVACMDCISVCSEGAISYTWRRPEASHADDTDVNAVNKGRRGFITGAGFLAAAVTADAIAKTTDGGFTPLKKKNPAARGVRIVPPGAVGVADFRGACTACQLCVQACPEHIIKPTLDLDGLLQPQLDYTEGYCRPTCTKCSDVCPVGAIKPIDVAQKSSVKIGTAVVNLESCISATDGVNCGNCARRCPAGAVKMVPVKEDAPDGPKMPLVKEEACIGCGACEYHCPAGTVADMASTASAIHVEGLHKHRII